MFVERFGRGVKNDPFQSNNRDKLVLPLKYIPEFDPTRDLQQRGSIIYDLADNEICYSDGTLWVHLLGQDASNQFTTNTSNIGPGSGLFAEKNGATLNFKGISVGDGIILVDATDQIILSATGVSPNVVLLPTGGSESLVYDGLGPVLTMRGISAGANITITEEGNAEVISASGGGTSAVVTLSSTSATHSLVNDGVSPDFVLKNLIAGANINIVSNSSMVVIESAGATSVTNLSSTGSGIFLVNNPTGPNLTVKSLVAGSNVTIISNGNDITIDSVAASGANVLLTSVGSTVTGAEYLVNDATGPNLALKRLASSQGILLSSDSTSVDIQNDTRMATIGSTGIDYVKTNTGPTYTLKEFVSGSGISLTSDSTSVHINFTGTSVSDPLTFVMITAGTLVIPSNAINIQCVAWAAGGGGGGGLELLQGGGGGGGGGAIANVDVFPGDTIYVTAIGLPGNITAGGDGGAGGRTILNVVSTFDTTAPLKPVELGGGSGGQAGSGGGGPGGTASPVIPDPNGYVGHTVNTAPYRVFAGAPGAGPGPFGNGGAGARLTGRNEGGARSTPLHFSGAGNGGGAGGGGKGGDSVLALNPGMDADVNGGGGGGGAGQSAVSTVYAGGYGGGGAIWLSYRLLL